MLNGFPHGTKVRLGIVAWDRVDSVVQKTWLLEMTSTFIITNLFKLPGGLTVLACEGQDSTTPIKPGALATILGGQATLHAIRLSGERTMLNQERPRLLRAFETVENVPLTVEQAQSGQWMIAIDSAAEVNAPVVHDIMIGEIEEPHGRLTLDTNG